MSWVWSWGVAGGCKCIECGCVCVAALPVERRRRVICRVWWGSYWIGEERANVGIYDYVECRFTCGRCTVLVAEGVG